MVHPCSGENRERPDMHGLILRTVQTFLQDTYGTEVWECIAIRAGLETPQFEAMLHYDASVLQTLLDAAAAELNKPVETLLEDIGTYLISHPNSAGVRRLLRFGGVDFSEFLYSLEDLPDRVQLAVCDLVLPRLELRTCNENHFDLRVCGSLVGFGHVLVGVLRAMADDYGALALLDHTGRVGQFEEIAITVVETDFFEGRNFDLAGDCPTKKVS